MDFFRYEYKNATDINIKIQLGQCNLQQKDKWQRQKFRDYTCQLIKKKKCQSNWWSACALCNKKLWPVLISQSNIFKTKNSFHFN